MKGEGPRITVGLEWHQRLKSHKLFCKCPSEVGVNPEGYETRYLRISSSELGEQDPAALLEAHRARRFRYGYSPSAACLVELDESPPHSINEEALRIALKIALMFKMQIVDEVRVMRKVVLDGSNTTGFQRTMLIAIGTPESVIETSMGKIRLSTLCLEEESAFIEKSETKEAYYRLDRLGIPLVEIATEPDIHSPEQAREVAEEVGLRLRLTGDVQRGLGTIRQDLNISIEGGSRQEIKGLQELELIDKIVRLEACRQLSLLKIKDELLRRNIQIGDFLIFDVTPALMATESPIIKSAISRGERVFCLPAPGFEGILGMELQPNRRFGAELADYARVWGGVEGLIHSDELSVFGISESDAPKIRKLCFIEERSAFILVIGDEKRATAALRAIQERLKMAIQGVPSETRKAEEDGTTSYLRPLPGPARMYPETDLPPIIIEEKLLKEMMKTLPPTPSEYIKKLISLGLNEHMANQIVRSPKLPLFEDAIKAGIEPTLIASCILNLIPMLRRDGIPVDSIPENSLLKALMIVTERKMPKELLPDLLKELTMRMDVEEAINAIHKGRIEEKELRRLLRELVHSRIDFVKQKGKDSIGALMGVAMQQLRGRAAGSDIYRILKEEVEKVI